MDKIYIACFSDRRLSRRKNQRRSLERLKKSFTMTNITDLIIQQNQNSSDFGSNSKPTSVTEPCTGAIPETIMEENERKLSKGDNILVTSKDLEVSVETEPLMTISNDTSEIANLAYLPSYNSIDKYKTQSDFLLDESSPVPIPLLEREPVSRCRSQPITKDFGFRERDMEMESLTEQNKDFIEAGSSQKHNTVIGNSKVKPNNPAFDKAIGFLLDSKKEKHPVLIKRVKFNQ